MGSDTRLHPIVQHCHLSIHNGALALLHVPLREEYSQKEKASSFILFAQTEKFLPDCLFPVQDRFRIAIVEFFTDWIDYSQGEFTVPFLHKGDPDMSDTPGRNEKSRVSRRDFLKGSGAAAAVTTLATLPQGLAEAQEDNPQGAYGPGPVAITLKVNGAEMKTKVEPRVTLLDALRNYLDVTGCKRVCDRGSCGACTVMLDGKTVYSCSTLAIEAQGKEIRTAESLNQDGKLDAVPAAFADSDAQQCGFCTPGFVVSIRAALDANPNATPEEIEKAVSGNICRCGTYQQMREAITTLCNAGNKKEG